MGPPDAIVTIATGGLWGLVALAGIDLASFVVAIFATRLLDDVELDYQPRIFRCYFKVKGSRHHSRSAADEQRHGEL